MDSRSGPDRRFRAAIYARVSTTDQTCDLQLRELRDYAFHRGWHVSDEYVDRGWSGAKTSRPELNGLMQDARRCRFDAVLVWKLDRWGRSLVHCVGAIQELTSLGIRFLAVSQGLDTDQSNPASQLLMHILAAVAQFERELIRERVAAGMRNAKAKGTHSGKPIGRPRKVFDREEVVRLRRQGLPIASIARQTGLGHGTVVRVLQAAENGARRMAPGRVSPLAVEVAKNQWAGVYLAVADVHQHVPRAADGEDGQDLSRPSAGSEEPERIAGINQAAALEVPAGGQRRPPRWLGCGERGGFSAAHHPIRYGLRLREMENGDPA